MSELDELHEEARAASSPGALAVDPVLVASLLFRLIDYTVRATADRIDASEGIEARQALRELATRLELVDQRTLMLDSQLRRVAGKLEPVVDAVRNLAELWP